MATTALGGTLAVPASAQTSPPAQPTPVPTVQPTQLDAVTTAATRVKRPIDAVPGTVSVITTEDMDRENVQDIRDLVRNEPGVSVGSQPNRGGSTNFVIRGIGGNRVLVIVDGMRSPDFPGSNQGGANFNRDYIDLENMKRVEIVRGPASALYGSDALGGVVAYTTKDPSDYLTPGGRDYYASLKAAYNGANDSFAETFTGVARGGKVEFLGLYTRRDGHNNKLGNSYYESNPQTWGENNFLGKLVLRPSETDTIPVIGEVTDKITKTRVLSSVGDSPVAVAKVYDEWGNDRTQHYRLSAQWEHNAPIGFVDRIDFMAYYSGMYRYEDTATLRGAVASVVPSNMRTSSYSFAQDVFGTELQMESKGEIFGLANQFVYGGSFSWTYTTRPRNRQQITLATGVTTPIVPAPPAPGGEQTPSKNFPDSDILQTGIYLQDEITAGRFTVTPAARLDYYSLMPKPDSDYWRSTIGLTSAPTIGVTNYLSASPKLGVIYRFTDQYSTYAQYGRGFRAPPYDSGNFGFNNSGAGYQIISNNSLKPETVDGFEAGFRGKYKEGSSWALSGFYNTYSNFIDTVQVGTSAGTIIFQYQNLPKVDIYGFEARGEYRIAPQWGLLGYFAFARGTDTTTGLAIDSVDPWKLQGRLRYGVAGTGFGAQLIGTVVGTHHNVSNEYYFQAPNYATLDLTASYEWNPHFKVNVGGFNVTNAKYWNSQDVIGVASNSTVLDRYTNPGRYFGANLTLKW